MKHFKILLFIFFIFKGAFVYSQKESGNGSFRGTIKVKRNTTQLVVLSKKDKVLPGTTSVRTMSFRWGTYDYKEYFPNGYTSQLFPLVFNRMGIFLVDEKKKVTKNTVVGFIYEVYESNTFAFAGTAEDFTATEPFRIMSTLPAGSCLWIRKLEYIDESGVLHKNEIGEFKVLKIN